MVQPSSWIRLRQAAGGTGWGGCLRPHGDGAHRASSRAPAGAEAGCEDRSEREGPDRRRAAGIRTAGLAAAFLAFAACSPQAPAQNASAEQGSPQTGLQQVPLTIRSATGEHRFTVQVAATAEEQEQGLMFYRSLGPEEGMIFPY